MPDMEHGPQMHGILLVVLMIAAVVGGLVYLAWGRVVKGKRSDNHATDGSDDG